MKLNIQSDDYKLQHSATFYKDIKIIDLELYFVNFLKKFPNKLKNWKIENKLVFYNIEENRVIESNEILIGKKEFNLKFLKHFKIKNKNLKTKLNIAELITKITEAEINLKVNEPIKNNSNLLNYNNLILNLNSFPLLINEMEIIQSFVNNFRNIPIAEASLRLLIEMGFEENRSRLALILAKNHLSHAGDLLLNSNFETIFNSVGDFRIVKF